VNWRRGARALHSPAMFDNEFAEAFRRVQARYTAEEFGNKRIDELIAEVWAEIDRLRAEQNNPGFS